MSNEACPELLSLHGINSTVTQDSAARSVMFGSHFSQRLPIKGATEKRLQTGVEEDMAKYTFSIKMPEDGTILFVIDRYPPGLDSDAIPGNPETLVIYEDDKTKEIGCFLIPLYASYHQYFGFEYKKTPMASKIAPGAFFEKGTIFADSPSVGENNGLKTGIELNMCFMSHEAGSEDGVMICNDVLPRLQFKVYENRTVECGSNSFLLNTYGTRDKPKPFPDIGECVREDGILAISRTYDVDLSPVEMSITDVMEPDYIFDTPTYVRGGGGRVIDIRMYHDENESSPTPTLLMDGVKKYSRALKRYYRKILDAEKSIIAERKKKYGTGDVVFKPELNQLIFTAYAILADQFQKSAPKLIKQYRKAPVDDYRIEFVIEYTLTPTIGNKLTCCHGGKGVVVQVVPPERMPVDKNGKRADIVMDSGANINRMNLGRLTELYIGAACQDLSEVLRKQMGIEKQPAKKAIKLVQQLRQTQPGLIENVRLTMLDFFRQVNETQLNHYAKYPVEEWDSIIADMVENDIYLYLPSNSKKPLTEIVKDIEKTYPPTYGPVTFIGRRGNRVTTVDNCRIGPLYIMLLEKISDDWSSVSSGKLQHFGVLSPMTKSEKFSFPFRNSPVRTIGETEGRIFAGYAGREAIAEMMDRSNSPTTHSHVYMNILKADRPFEINEAVDRHSVPLGGAKPIQLFKHIAMVNGYEVVYEPPQEYNWSIR